MRIKSELLGRLKQSLPRQRQQPLGIIRKQRINAHGEQVRRLLFIVDRIHMQAMADARAQFIGATGDFEQILASYQELFGEQPSHAALPTVHPQLDDVASVLVSRALENNFAINRAQSQSQAAQFVSDAEQAGRYPKLSLEMAGRQYEANRIGNRVRDPEVRTLLKVQQDQHLFGFVCMGGIKQRPKDVIRCCYTAFFVYNQAEGPCSTAKPRARKACLRNH